MPQTYVGTWRDYPHYGLTHYRIWMRLAHGVWMQRHEWRQESGKSRFDGPNEGWIIGCQVAPGEGYTLLDEDEAAEPFTYEPTPEGMQAVIPGCERNASPGAVQLSLFG